MVLYKGSISGFVLIFLILRAQWPKNQRRICSYCRSFFLQTSFYKEACTHKILLLQKGWLL